MKSYSYVVSCPAYTKKFERSLPQIPPPLPLQCACNSRSTHLRLFHVVNVCKIDRKMVVLNWKGGKSDLIRGELLLLSKQEAAYIGIQYICQLQFTVEMLLATTISSETCRASGFNLFLFNVNPKMVSKYFFFHLSSNWMLFGTTAN